MEILQRISFPHGSSSLKHFRRAVSPEAPFTPFSLRPRHSILHHAIAAPVSGLSVATAQAPVISERYQSDPCSLPRHTPPYKCAPLHLFWNSASLPRVIKARQQGIMYTLRQLIFVAVVVLCLLALILAAPAKKCPSYCKKECLNPTLCPPQCQECIIN
ncbi:hypothetical protein MRX96_006615 [Rhipicephalus microplus]